MRSASFFLALSLVASVFAAPLSSPALASKDPMSLHRRAALPETEMERDLPYVQVAERDQPSERAAVPAWNVSGYDDEPLDTDMEDDMDFACAAECAVQQIHGAHNEREALCSPQGLKTTLSCAQCIDATWPDTSYEDSAVAEYERIALDCQEGAQHQSVHSESL